MGCNVSKDGKEKKEKEKKEKTKTKGKAKDPKVSRENGGTECEALDRAAEAAADKAESMVQSADGILTDVYTSATNKNIAKEKVLSDTNRLPVRITEDEIKKAIGSLRKGSAPGPDAQTGAATTNEVDEDGNPVIDVDLNDPATAQAATKIQAAFRGSQVRKTLKTTTTTTTTVSTTTTTMQETHKNDGSGSPMEDIDPNDPEVNQAAAKIQASFRGHKVRKEMQKKKEEQPKPEVSPKEEEEEIDIDLNDPDVRKAATKIQASFRGHLVRKQIQTQTENNTA